MEAREAEREYSMEARCEFPMRELEELIDEILSWGLVKEYICNQPTCEGFKNGCIHATPHEDRGSCFGGCADDPSKGEHRCNLIVRPKGKDRNKSCFNCKHGDDKCIYADEGTCHTDHVEKWEQKANCMTCKHANKDGSVVLCCRLEDVVEKDDCWESNDERA